MREAEETRSGRVERAGIFLRHRHGTPIFIEPNVKAAVRQVVEQLRSDPDHGAVLRRAVRDIADGSGSGVAPSATWIAALRELFSAYERSHPLDEGTTNTLLKLIEIVISDRQVEESWDSIRAYLIENADVLSGWQELKRVRGVSFFGEVRRASDGTYYTISERGEKIQIIGAKTAEEERFEYIAEDAMSRYGRIGGILRFVSLLDIADQYTQHPDHFSDRVVCLLPDDTSWTAYLQWSWHVSSRYHYVPAPWKPRSNFSDPEWLAADLVAAFPDAPDTSTESLSPPQDKNLEQFRDASTGNPYQYDLALETDLFLGEGSEAWFDFEGRKIRWINGTRFVYPTLTVWAKTGEEGSWVARRFLSVLVREAKTSIVEIAAVGSSPHYYPLIRQPRTIGGLGMDPKYLLGEETTKFSDQKWLALALYKEAVNSNSVYYSFLCFYKILELAFHDDEGRCAKWIDGNISPVLQHMDDKWRQEVLPPGQAPSLHLKEARRHAVAHAGVGGKLRSGAVAVNPDDPVHYRAFSRDLRVIRGLADKVLERKIVQ